MGNCSPSSTFASSATQHLMTDAVLPQLWFDAASTSSVDESVRRLYRDIALATAKQNPRCDQSARCCHFEEYGHRLYVTGLETAWFLLHAGRSLSPDEIEDATARGTCPFLMNGLCSVHSVRPMGCRIFFCDSKSRQWQEDVYQRCHRTIADLHDRLEIPYRYGEWRSMLRLCADYAPATILNEVEVHDSSSQQFIHVRISI